MPWCSELWVSVLEGSSLLSWALCLPSVGKTRHLPDCFEGMLEFFLQDCGIVCTRSKCFAAWLPFLGESPGFSQQTVFQHLLTSEGFRVILLCVWFLQNQWISLRSGPIYILLDKSSWHSCSTCGHRRIFFNGFAPNSKEFRMFALKFGCWITRSSPKELTSALVIHWISWCIKTF